MKISAKHITNNVLYITVILLLIVPVISSIVLFIDFKDIPFLEKEHHFIFASSIFIVIILMYLLLFASRFTIYYNDADLAILVFGIYSGINYYFTDIYFYQLHHAKAWLILLVIYFFVKQIIAGNKIYKEKQETSLNKNIYTISFLLLLFAFTLTTYSVLQYLGKLPSANILFPVTGPFCNQKINMY